MYRQGLAPVVRGAGPPEQGRAGCWTVLWSQATLRKSSSFLESLSLSPRRPSTGGCGHHSTEGHLLYSKATNVKLKWV